MKKRIILLIVCVTIIAQVITMIAAIGSFQNSYQADIVASLKGELNAIGLGTADATEDPQLLAEQYAQAFGQGIRVTVISEDGTVIADSQDNPATLENHADRPEVIQAQDGDFGTDTRTSETTGMETIYVAKQMNGITLRLSIPLENTSVFVQQALPVMIITFIILTIIALVFSGLLARGILAPMRKLHTSIQDYMDGETKDIKIESKYEELEDISQMFTSLSDRLKRYIAQVKLENKKSSIILDNIQEGLMVLDEDQDVLLINNTARMIFDAEDDVTSVNLLHFARSPQITKPIEKAFQKHRKTSFDVFDDETGKTYRYFLSFVTPGTFAKQGDGMLVLIMDVTEIIQAEKVRTDFAANVSHELKTPLTSINGYAQLIENNMVQDGEDIKQYAHYITVEADRLMGLINDTLALSELEAISIDEKVEPVPMIDIARHVQGMLAQKLQNSDITMAVEGDATVIANRNRMKQLLLNLCDNAIKYNQPGGNISIHLSESNHTATISVKDTGIGIPENEKDRVFERFYRAKNAGGATINGTGLGLAIVKHIVQLYNGAISINSSLNSGTEFIVTLPQA